MIRTSLQARMKRLFTEGFIAMDIADPLFSFDYDKSASEVRSFMSGKNLGLVGIRRDGVMAGYVEGQDLQNGKCSDHMHHFSEEQVLPNASHLPQVIEVLNTWKYCFITILGSVGAVITRDDLHKPAVRMWLFGMITIVEMFLVRMLEEKYPDDSWRSHLSPARLKKAEQLQEERIRRNNPANLVDCLQFSDKAQILMKDPDLREDSGFDSKNEGERGIKALESLRNNLAHSQDIISSNWDAIVRMSQRLEKIMTRI
jgi:hypothetical protein